MLNYQPQKTAYYNKERCRRRSVPLTGQGELNLEEEIR